MLLVDFSAMQKFCTYLALIAALLLLPETVAASNFDSNDRVRLDSLVGADRYGAYEYLGRALEEYLQSDSSELLGRLHMIATSIDQQFGDSWWSRQVTLYSGWDADARTQRAGLFQKFATMFGGNEELTDSAVVSLATEFLTLGDSAAAAKVYHNGGLMLARQRQIKAAQRLLGASVTISRQAGDLADLARAWHSLGTIYEKLDSLIWAGNYFDSSLTVRNRIGDSLGVAVCLNHIGAIYLQFEEHVRAREYFDEALRLCRQANDTVQTLDVLFHLLEAFSQQESEATLVGWLEEIEALGAEGLPRYSIRLIQAQALVAQKRGEYQQALMDLGKALVLVRPPMQPRLRLSLLIRQAALFNATGKYDRALSGYLEAYDLAQATGNPQALADIVHNLGATAQRLGLLESAAEYYRDAVNRNRRLGRVCAVTAALGNLIEVYLSRSEPALAERYEQELETTSEYCDDPRTRAQTCLVLAQLISPDYLDTARQYFQALNDRQGELLTLIAEAEHAREQHLYKEANELLGKAALLVAQADVYENRQRYELARGMLAYDAKQFDTAYHYLARVIDRLEATRRSLPETHLRAARQSRSRFVYETMTMLWWQRLKAGSAPAVDSLVRYLESAKSRTLLDLLSGGRELQRSETVDSLRQKERQLLQQLEQYELQAQLRREAPVHQALLHTADSLSRELEQMRLKISLADPQSQQIYEPGRVDLAQIKTHLLDSSTLVLDYLLTPERSILVALDRQQVRVLDLPSRPEIAGALIDYLALLRGSATIDSLQTPFVVATDSLSSLLLGDMVEDLDSYRKLLISTDGPLAVLPFGALRVDSSYLAERLEITYLPSLHLLEAEKRQHPDLAQASLLAIAVPDAEGMASLRYSREEVNSIARLFDSTRSEILIGVEAAKEILQSEQAQQFDYLHFATHSSINHDDPLRSKLWLSADTSSSLAALSLAEVMHLRLAAELVALSSCESGGGRYRLGEGIEGFVRGFLYAGAERVLVSLWPVEDLATMEFMVGFYEQLGFGYGESLRRTKLKLIHSNRLRLRHPYYWSPFILISAN